MSNIVAQIMEQAANAASSNPYMAGGMVAAGVLIGIGTWIHKRRKARKNVGNK